MSISRSRILKKLPRECFTFKKRREDEDGGEEVNEDVTKALGIDLSKLSATQLADDALSAFPLLTRLSLKENQLSKVSALPSTLTYLDLSKNPALISIEFVKSLPNLITLILSDCHHLTDIVDNLRNLSKNLKVLLLDRCQLKTTNIVFPSNLSTLTTLIISHNPDIESLDMKELVNLTKLSASNNSSLKCVKNLSSRNIAEIRLGHCPSISSLDFLSIKRQNKLAFLDLSFCPLIENFLLLKKHLNVISLLTLNLKGTPLRDSFENEDKFEKELLKTLKCKKLKSLDFSKVRTDIAALLEEQEVDDQEEEEAEESEEEEDDAEDFPETPKQLESGLPLLLEEEENEESKEDVKKAKKSRVVEEEDEELFSGKSKGSW